MTLTNTACLGNGFFGEGSCLRDGNNTRQYPASSCGGSVHCFGEYIMGSLWKMRENLIELHGYENGVAISDDFEILDSFEIFSNERRYYCESTL